MNPALEPMRLTPIRFSHLLAVLVLGMSLTSCHSVTGLENATVSAVAAAAGILVSNQTTFSVQEYSIAGDALPLWDTAQCFEGWKVRAGEARTFAWPQIYLSTPARTRYVTMWWRDGACSFESDGDPRGRLLVSR
jgi:hypothetical protein